MGLKTSSFGFKTSSMKLFNKSLSHAVCPPWQTAVGLGGKKNFQKVILLYVKIIVVNLFKVYRYAQTSLNTR